MDVRVYEMDVGTKFSMWKEIRIDAHIRISIFERPRPFSETLTFLRFSTIPKVSGTCSSLFTNCDLTNFDAIYLLDALWICANTVSDGLWHDTDSERVYKTSNAVDLSKRKYIVNYSKIQ